MKLYKVIDSEKRCYYVTANSFGEAENVIQEKLSADNSFIRQELRTEIVSMKLIAGTKNKLILNKKNEIKES